MKISLFDKTANACAIAHLQVRVHGRALVIAAVFLYIYIWLLKNGFSRKQEWNWEGSLKDTGNVDNFHCGRKLSRMYLHHERSRLWRRNQSLSAGWKAIERRRVLWFPSTVEDSSLKLLCGRTMFLKLLCRTTIFLKLLCGTTMYLKSRVYLTRFELDICCTSSNDRNCFVSNYLDIKYMLSHGQANKGTNLLLSNCTTSAITEHISPSDIIVFID